MLQQKYNFLIDYFLNFGHLDLEDISRDTGYCMIMSAVCTNTRSVDECYNEIITMQSFGEPDWISCNTDEVNIFCENCINSVYFYLTALKGCRGSFFTLGVWMGRRAAGKRLFGLYLRNGKV